MGKNGGRKYFYSVEKIKEWIDKELNYWNWIRKCNIQGKNNLVQRQLHPIDELKRNASNLQEEDQNFQEKIKHVENLINKYYGQNQIFHSSHPKAKYVNRLKKENQNSAAYTLLHFHGINLNTADGNYFIGLLNAFLYDRDIKAFNESNRDVIHELEVDLKEQVEDFKKTIKDKESQLDALYDSESNKFSDKKKEIEEFLKDSNTEITRIENVYDQRLALQASVRYWKTKGKSHEKLGNTYKFFFIGSLVVTAALLFVEIYFLLGNYSIENAPPYWITAIVLLTAGICIWVSRILAKIFLSNIHLKAEAEERRVMILTFLSLLRREEAISPDDKKVILQTLFRPSSTGILKEDKLPSTLWDQITRQ